MFVVTLYIATIILFLRPWLRCYPIVVFYPDMITATIFISCIMINLSKYLMYHFIALPNISNLRVINQVYIKMFNLSSFLRISNVLFKENLTKYEYTNILPYILIFNFSLQIVMGMQCCNFKARFCISV